MGSWSETCGITQLPIFNGDPVRLFFLNLVGNPEVNHAGHCYSNSIWSPQYLPVAARYNDYGGVEDVVENSLTRHIINSVRDDLIAMRLRAGASEVSERKNDTLDIEDFGIEDLVEQIHEDRLWTSGTSRDLPMGWMMVHEWVYQQLTEQIDLYWRGAATRTQVYTQGVQFYQCLLQQVKSPRWLTFGKRFVFYQIEDQHRDNIFSSLCNRSGLDSYLQLRGIEQYLGLLSFYAEKELHLESTEVVEVLAALSEFFCFRSNMSAMRKQWAPQSGKGSQQGEFDAYRRLFEGALKWMAQREREWDLDEG